MKFTEHTFALAATFGLLLAFLAAVAHVWSTIAWWYPPWALVVFVLAAAVGARFRLKSTPPALEPLLGFMGASAVLLLPAPRGVGMATVSVAVLLAQVLWAHGRYTELFPTAPSPKDPLMRRVVKAMSTGALYAVGLSVIAAIIYAIATAQGSSPPPDYPSLRGVVAAYFGGGVTAGLLVGLLWHFSRNPVGTCMLGVIGATCAYSAVGISMDGLSAETMQTGLFIGCLVGPAAGLAVRFQWAGRAGPWAGA